MSERTALEIADKLDYLTRSVMSIRNVPTLPHLCDFGEKAAEMLRSQAAEIEMLRAYVGKNTLMSDFRNADEMRSEIDRLTALNSALAAKSNAFVIENARQAEKIDRLTAEKFRRFNNEECWVYQRGGENHLGSLTCPVVISPEALLSMRADISRLNAERDEAIAAVATEREACAKVCDELEALLPGTKTGNTLQWAAESIRARGKS